MYEMAFRQKQSMVNIVQSVVIFKIEKNRSGNWLNPAPLQQRLKILYSLQYEAQGPPGDNPKLLRD